jgi:hypothetical protein
MNQISDTSFSEELEKQGIDGSLVLGHPSVGFDGDRRARRSGPRTHGYLANDPCKPIGADNKRTDFALAA